MTCDRGPVVAFTKTFFGDQYFEWQKLAIFSLKPFLEVGHHYTKGDFASP